MKIGKLILVLLLAFILILAILPAALAAEQTNFPLMALNGTDLIADANTRFITCFEQNPVSKLITATVQIKHGGSAQDKELVIHGIGIEISFDENRVAPYAYSKVNPNFDPNLLFSGRSVTDDAEFSKYCQPLITDFNIFGSQLILRNGNGGAIGAKFSCSKLTDELRIAPATTVDIIEFYFMPVNGTDMLDLDMFSYQYVFDASKLIRLSTWLGNGSRFLDATALGIPNNATFIISPTSFKIHMKRPQPRLTADNTARTIIGYNPLTMEWSDTNTKESQYVSATPVIGEGYQMIYIRNKGDSVYSGNDSTYGAYKTYLASDPVAICFLPTDGAEVVVTFNANGGKPSLQSSTLSPGSFFDLSMPEEPLRDNHSFNGWYFQPDGSGTQFTSTSIVTENITVYAQWTEKIPKEQVVVSFNANGGTGSIDSQNLDRGATYTMQTDGLTRAGYNFNSWNTAADGSGTTYVAGSVITLYEDITLYAQWRIKSNNNDRDRDRDRATPATPAIKTEDTYPPLKQIPSYYPLEPLHAAGTKVAAAKTNNPLLLEEEETVFPAVKISGYNWIKLRDFAMLLNGTSKRSSISYDANTRIIDIRTGQDYQPLGDELSDKLEDKDLETAISTMQRLRVDGKFVNTAAYNINGYNYLRLRDIAIILDFAVIYDEDSGEITLDFDKSYSEGE